MSSPFRCLPALHITVLIAALTSGGICHADGTVEPGPLRSKSEQCNPLKTNTFMPLFGEPIKYEKSGGFEPFPLTPEQAKIGFLAWRAADGVYIVVPNKIAPTMISWVQLTTKKGNAQIVCASRVAIVFEVESATSDYSSLVQIAKANTPNARFVRPLMQNVQLEWTIPFIGLLNRYDPRPTFPLGGAMMVWDLDMQNTLVLERFIRNAGPSVTLPGVLMMREMQTGLTFSISLTIEGEKLLKSRYDVSVDRN